MTRATVREILEYAATHGYSAMIKELDRHLIAEALSEVATENYSYVARRMGLKRTTLVEKRRAHGFAFKPAQNKANRDE